LGKTVETLALIILRVQDQKVKGPTMVVAPPSVVTEWYRIIRQLTSIPPERIVRYESMKRFDLPADTLKEALIILTTYGTLTQDYQNYRHKVGLLVT
jgi:SNF2 family DNA or RNA helicase